MCCVKSVIQIFTMSSSGGDPWIVNSDVQLADMSTPQGQANIVNVVLPCFMMKVQTLAYLAQVIRTNPGFQMTRVTVQGFRVFLQLAHAVKRSFYGIVKVQMCLEHVLNAMDVYEKAKYDGTVIILWVKVIVRIASQERLAPR